MKTNFSLESKIPQAWKSFLKNVQSKFPHAIIAGGCLRDLDYGKFIDDIKDVDIFVPKKDFTRDEFHPAMQKLFGAAVTSNSSGIKEYADGYEEEQKQGRSIFGLYTIQDGGYTYEVIFGDDRTAEIEDFDMSICQIGYNGDAIFVTDHYEETKRTNQIVLVNARPAHRNGERIERMKIRFPTMEVIVPELPAEPDGLDFLL